MALKASLLKGGERRGAEAKAGVGAGEQGREQGGSSDLCCNGLCSWLDLQFVVVGIADLYYFECMHCGQEYEHELVYYR